MEVGVRRVENDEVRPVIPRELTKLADLYTPKTQSRQRKCSSNKRIVQSEWDTLSTTRYKEYYSIIYHYEAFVSGCCCVYILLWKDEVSVPNDSPNNTFPGPRRGSWVTLALSASTATTRASSRAALRSGFDSQGGRAREDWDPGGAGGGAKGGGRASPVSPLWLLLFILLLQGRGGGSEGQRRHLWWRRDGAQGTHLTVCTNRRKRCMYI